MKKTMIFIVAGLLIGLGVFINFENLNIFFLGLFCLGSAFIFRKFKLEILFLAIFIGFLLGFLKLRSFNLSEARAENVEILVLNKKKSNDLTRLEVSFKNKSYNQRGFIFTDEDFDIGESFKACADISLINKNTNPNLFNFRNYSLSRGLVSELKLKDFEEKEKRNISHNPFLSLRRRFNKYINRLFRENLSKKSADFAISLVLSDNLIGKDSFNRLGLSHILAISGLHIDLMLAFTIGILKRLSVAYKKSYLIGLGLCLSYGYLIGFPYSIMRVLIVNSISFLGFLLRRPIDSVKSLVLAGILIILIKPFAILNAGFILSFLASFSIVKFYPRFKLFFKEGLVRDLFSFTTSIQLACLAFTIYYFGYFNILSVLANFLVVPVFTIIAYISFILVFSYVVLSPILWPVFFMLDYLISSLLNMVNMLNELSIFTVEFAKPSLLLTIYTITLLFVFVNIKTKKYLGKFIALNLAILILSSYRMSPKRDISYQMIDIGQGDAFLLNDRGKYYMVDLGGPKFKNYDSGERILVPYLKSLGIKDIEAVFITHEDKDHVGNLKILLDNFNVKNIISTSHVSDDILALNPIFFKKNQRVELSDGYIECVFEGAGVENENDRSLGLLINIRGVKILTLGDLSSSYEDSLDIKADILKLSHHGSKTSTSSKFLAKVDPSIVLISAGKNNIYGHPSKEVLEKLDGRIILNTQTDGLIDINFGSELKVSKYLKGGFFR